MGRFLSKISLSLENRKDSVLLFLRKNPVSMNEGSKFIPMHKKEEREEWRRSENGGVEIKNTM